MNAQFYADRADAFELVFGQPIAIGRLGGEFSVVSGSVWLTRSGDLEDHWLRAGQRFKLAPGDVALVEPLDRRAAKVAWHPVAARAADVRRFGLRAVGEAASVAARAAGRLASTLAAIERRATAAAGC